ncbi:MAG: cysteine desulfurase family protein, partial [Candidatus Heimdallarchaeaceae archaeon]
VEVYLDWENGSVVSEDVFEAMKPFFLEKGFANPSITHRFGWETYEYYVEAKEKIAQPLMIHPQELNITHGLTECNNLAIKGVALANTKRKKIIISSVEHLSVIHTAKQLKDVGYIVEEIPVFNDGTIDTDFLQDKVDNDTLLVSIQLANHEIGTLQPIKESLEVVKDKDESILFHTDASSAFGRIPLNLKDLEVDLVSLDSSKILGPKGIGALYVREGVRVKALLEGQMSVETLSPGVEIMPLLIGFSKAVETQFKDFEEQIKRTIKLRDKLMYGLYTSIPKTIINGAEGTKRISDNVNLSFLGCEGEALTVESSMNGIYLSSGSACTSRVLMPSHILTAIGRKPEEAHGSLLMKINRLNTEDQIEYVLETMPKIVSRIRSITGSIEL